MLRPEGAHPRDDEDQQPEHAVREHGVDAVQNAPMARHDAARVLDTHRTLEQRFTEIAHDPEHAAERAEDDEGTCPLLAHHYPFRSVGRCGVDRVEGRKLPKWIHWGVASYTSRWKS